MHQNTNVTQQDTLSFWEAPQQLPRILLIEVLKRIGTSFVTLLITIVMLCIEREWMYCIGFALSLWTLYLSLDIVSKYRKGQIYVARMIISKIQKYVKRRGQVHAILRSASVKDVTTQETFETFQCDLPATLFNKGLLTPGTVLNIFFYENTPHTVLAYEVLGESNL